LAHPVRGGEELRLRLYGEGLSDREIAQQTEVQPMAIWSWRAKRGLPLNAGGRVGRDADFVVGLHLNVVVARYDLGTTTRARSVLRGCGLGVGACGKVIRRRGVA